MALLDFAVADTNLSIELRVDRVEVRRNVVVVIHVNLDPMEFAHTRHRDYASPAVITSTPM